MNSQGEAYQYTYNVLGQPKASQDARGNTTTYYYDKMGSILKQVNPDGGVERWVYNTLGQLTQHVLPGQYASGSDTTTFTAENIANAAGAYNATTHGHRYTYLANGLLQTELHTLNETTTYAYDVYGNILTQTLPNGSQYVFTYDVLNRQLTKSFKENSGATMQLTGTAIISSRRARVQSLWPYTSPLRNPRRLLPRTTGRAGL